ncbi:MAG: ferritin-like domain-containing protein, partial [Polyangiales bacterium]
ALDAAHDEVRHARVIGAIAREHGVEPAVARVEALPVRDLEAIALENALEGCVRETYGAVVGAYQAARAQDEMLRFAMHGIALDEARHAALSHDLHAWLMPRISEAARARIAQAQQLMIERLREQQDDAAVGALAGLPRPEVAHAMLDALERELWHAPAQAV